MSRAYLGLGSNLGDRMSFLAEGVQQLARTPNVRLVATSRVYESPAVGLTAQPDFLNLVAAIDTSLSPRALLRECLAVEARLGRVRHERWGPRTIDIDLLWYDGLLCDEEGLALPHPRLQERAFVVVPLAELAPELRLGERTARELCNQFDQSRLTNRGSLPAHPVRE